MSFAQGAPTQNLSIVSSNVFLYGSSTAGNAFTVQQLGSGNVASFVTSTGATSLIINPAGNVGIGKTNPAYALDITGDLNFTGTFRQNGTPYVGSQWTGTTSLYFVGNVGIGTNNPQYLLHVTGAAASTVSNIVVEAGTNAIGQRSEIRFGIPAFSGTGKRAGITSNTYVSDGSDLQFWTNATSGTASAPQMTILQSGFVGIGTTNPTKLLQVWGGMIIGASSDSRATTVTLNAPGATTTFSQNADIGDGARIMCLQCPDLSSTTANLVSFSLQVAPTGSFGSQRTSLDLKGFRVANQSYGGFCLTSAFDTGGSYDLFYADRTKAYFQQNVGIGTASPGTLLDVNGSMNAQNFAQPTFTNQQYTTITTATSMAAATYGSAGGITISKTASGTTTWDACAYSNQSYKYGAYCSARAGQTNNYVMWGLSANQTAANISTLAYASINYAWYFVADQTLQIYENGTQVATYGTYNVTTSCSITFDGSNIIYWKDGVAVRTVSRAVGSPLFFMCTPYQSGGATIYDVVFGPSVNTNNPGQVITASTGMFSNTIIACKTGALHSTGEAPGSHALMAFAPDGASGNSSIWMGFDPTNDCGYINSARSGQIRPIAIQTRGGNVGIGTTNPQYKHHVTNGDTSMTYYGPNATWSAYLKVGAGNSYCGSSIASVIASDGNLHIDCATNGKNIYLNYFQGGGSGGVNSTVGCYAAFTATGDITAFSSDERLKTKVGLIENALDKVCSLTAFKYIHNETARKNGFTDDNVYVGLSAQEVQKVLPEVVKPAPFDQGTEYDVGKGRSKSGENYLTVQYERIVSLLVEAVKEERAERLKVDESLRTTNERLARLEKLLLKE